MSKHTFPRIFLASLLLWLPSKAPADNAAPSPNKISFNRDVRPILTDNCFGCHGFDAKTRKAGLRLDIPEGIFNPAKSGDIAVVPRQLDQSSLWNRVLSSDPDEIMPPPDSRKVLSDAQKNILRLWIEQGAPHQQHWAFEPPVKAPLPTLPGNPNSPHPVDAFIRARLAQEGLSPSPEADRETLLRRLSFDLKGLPPTLSELETFLADARPDAYARLVERLMHSPHFGEHMARYWLDVARYADTHGMHLDNERSMWPYRDWVVRAFNRNLPFNEFTIDQIAGDLRPNPTRDQRIATGFNRNNVTTGEGGSIDSEFIFRYAVDRTSTTIQTWMGLTAGCAVCHDHKYDPISTRDFYSLYSFFNSAADPAMDGNVFLTPPFLKLNNPPDDEQLASFEKQIRQAEAKLTNTLASIAYADPSTMTPPPPARETQTVWVEDDFPSGAKAQSSGAPTQWVASDSGKVFSGKRALRREASEIGQDFYESGAAPQEIPADAALFAHVYLDPAAPPKSIMIQFNKGGWNHRAVWGDADAIDWGTKGSPSRARLGDLPKAGEWVRLEFPAEKVGLASGDKVTGLALTQFGGIVHWDLVGVKGLIDPANDPSRSFIAWKKQYDGKEAKDLPEKLRKIFKDTPAEQRTAEQTQTLRDHYLSRVCADLKPVFDPLFGDIDSLRKKRDDFDRAIPASLVFRDMEKPRESFIMMRGQYDKPGEKVTPGVPAVFPPLANTNNPTRLDLARWLVSAEHPLVARVAVNRFWQQFFGAGLVRTPDDFGSQGAPPTHPELLDWLAVSFRESGWDVKALVRLFVTSATYRQSSRFTPELLQKDPQNQLLARGSRFRFDAEQIRDNVLFVSGLIDLAIGGRGVRPYQPPNIWEPVAFVGSNTGNYQQEKGASLYRRSLYTFFKRTAPPPFMSSFDAPNREQFCTQRERSNTPMQALQLLNDVQHFEAARALAQRMILQGGDSLDARLRFAWKLVLSRLPEPQELQVAQDAFQQHLARYQKDPEAAKQAIAFGDSKPDASLDPAQLAAYTLTANLLLNLDETVTRN